MLTVNIICVGKLKEKYWKDACQEYAKRLGAFCKFSIIEVDEHKVSGNPSQSEIKAAIASEGKKILSKLSQGTAVIAMCIEGKELSSPDLSSLIEKYSVTGTSNISFIIGGSWGLSDDIKNIASFKLSMSPMTFPHQLARVMLCEQIYRAFQILSDGKYHK